MRYLSAFHAISPSILLRIFPSSSSLFQTIHCGGSGGVKAASGNRVTRHFRIHTLTRMVSSEKYSSSSNAIEEQERSSTKTFVVDPFCYRQFAEMENSKGYAGAVFDMSIQQFEETVNAQYNLHQYPLQNGYAPFCKHLFLPNDFSNVRVNVLPITPENEHCLRTRYEARNDNELPVLTRYFDRELLLSSSSSSSFLQSSSSIRSRRGDGDSGHEDGNDENATILPVAKYLDIILYSREQINKENAAMGKTMKSGSSSSSGSTSTSIGTVEEEEEEGLEKKNKEVDEMAAPWGIVSIKAQDVDYELPMTPITIMRNALGKDQGGSGVELNREAYMQSVEYWKDRANVL